MRVRIPLEELLHHRLPARTERLTPEDGPEDVREISAGDVHRADAAVEKMEAEAQSSTTPCTPVIRRFENASAA